MSIYDCSKTPEDRAKASKSGYHPKRVPLFQKENISHEEYIEEVKEISNLLKENSKLLREEKLRIISSVMSGIGDKAIFCEKALRERIKTCLTIAEELL